MPFTEDLTPFFADFGIAATVGGVSVRGLFDAAYADAFGVAGAEPVLRCASADVSAVAQGAAVVVPAGSYTVAGIEPDGSGITLLRLEAA